MPEEYSRTEPATPRRREEVRKRGQVAKSIEVNSAFILLGLLILLRFFGRKIFQHFFQFMQYVFSNLSSIDLNMNNFSAYLIAFFLFLGKILLPIMGLAFLLGLIANFSQVGFLISIFPLTPTLEKINPISGFTRLFSIRSFVELVKSILKIIIVGYIAYATIKADFNKFIPMMNMELISSSIIIVSVAFNIALRIAIALLILSLADYLYQRLEFEKSIRMTRQEVREEYKQLEGDPLLRARIRQRQREIARRRMMQEVPRADVVITNPVHLAVALLYEEEKMRAPKVIAKGQRLIAEQIKQIAKENNIPIVENPPLAQSLFKSCEVGDEIPSELYHAVAEILAFVYSLSKKRKVG